MLQVLHVSGLTFLVAAKLTMLYLLRKKKKAIKQVDAATTLRRHVEAYHKVKVSFDIYVLIINPNMM